MQNSKRTVQKGINKVKNIHVCNYCFLVELSNWVLLLQNLSSDQKSMKIPTGTKTLEKNCISFYCYFILPFVILAGFHLSNISNNS